jgi:hypothetical protein
MVCAYCHCAMTCMWTCTDAQGLGEIHHAWKGWTGVNILKTSK